MCPAHHSGHVERPRLCDDHPPGGSVRRLVLTGDGRQQHHLVRKRGTDRYRQDVKDTEGAAQHLTHSYWHSGISEK